MSDYFKYFSKNPVKYKVFTNSDILYTLSDITKRFKLSDKLKKDAVIKYNLSDGERPDTIAFDYYERSSLDWLVLLANEIQDPLFDWYMGYYDFKEYIIEKYDSLENSHQYIHKRIKLVNNREIIIDEDTFNSTPVEDRKEITKFQYEDELNNSKKVIKLVRKEFVISIIDDLKEIFK